MKTEGRIQQECIMYFNNTYPEYRMLLFEVNNNSTSKESGSKHKALGRKSGVSDLIYLSYFGVFCLECKTEIGIQTEDQKKWQASVESAGYKYIIFRSLDEFKKIITDIHCNNVQL